MARQPVPPRPEPQGGYTRYLFIRLLPAVAGNSRARLRFHLLGSWGLHHKLVAFSLQWALGIVIFLWARSLW